jgi:hypothetical protein
VHGIAAVCQACCVLSACAARALRVCAACAACVQCVRRVRAVPVVVCSCALCTCAACVDDVPFPGARAVRVQRSVEEHSVHVCCVLPCGVHLLCCAVRSRCTCARCALLCVCSCPGAGALQRSVCVLLRCSACVRVRATCAHCAMGNSCACVLCVRAVLPGTSEHCCAARAAVLCTCCAALCVTCYTQPDWIRRIRFCGTLHALLGIRADRARCTRYACTCRLC